MRKSRVPGAGNSPESPRRPQLGVVSGAPSAPWAPWASINNNNEPLPKLRLIAAAAADILLSLLSSLLSPCLVARAFDSHNFFYSLFPTFLGRLDAATVPWNQFLPFQIALSNLHFALARTLKHVASAWAHQVPAGFGLILVR